MQKVSPEYVESMKSIGRNRGYIKVTLGIVNSEAQKNIEVSNDTDLAYFSQEKLIDGAEITQPYATCEQNWSNVDGRMYFLPADVSGSVFYNNGIVSEDLLGSITFDFGGDVYDVAGFTIDFGENYPIDFTISNDIEILTFTDNDKRYFSTEQGLHDIQTLTITATRMLDGQTRLRIYSLSMGVFNTFTNENTLDYSETTFVSPIADTLPSTDVTIKVVNYDNYYNPDNPNSILAFFEVGQEVRVQFGYDTNDDGIIEWLPETVSHLKTWSATDRDATFTATDVFDFSSGVYYGGQYYDDGISLFALAEDVFRDAGIDDYKIDTSLEDIIVYNPLPAVDFTQALQIIANAGRCTLREDRDGKIYIESVYIPDIAEFTITSNGETDYSNVANIKNQTSKTAYGLQSKDFSQLKDISLLFLDTPDLENVGYVSGEICNASGVFTTNPVITIDMGQDYSAPPLNIQFRNVAPQQFTIRAYFGQQVVQTVNVSNPDLIYSMEEGFEECDRITVEFTKGAPNSRIVIDTIWFGSPINYTLYRNQFFDSPVATRQERIKSISVNTYDYNYSTEEIKDLITTTLKNVQEDEYVLYPNNPSYGYEVEVIEGIADAEITETSAYSVGIYLSNISGDDVKIVIRGYEFSVNEQPCVVEHNLTGAEKTWSNPLISDVEHARMIESWLADYYLGDVEYEFEWRGDPRIDADDLMNLELKTGEIVSVRNYQNSMDFAGAWSGRMKARKVLIREETIRTKVTPPTVTADFTYDGEVHTATISNYDPTIMSLSGQLSATDAGNYTIVATLLDTEHYEWNNGNISPRKLHWKIAKAQGTGTISTNSVELTPDSPTATVTVSNASGEVSVRSNQSDVIASISGNTITISTTATEEVTAVVTVNIAPTTNYDGLTKTIDVTYSVLTIVSWADGTDAEISAMLDAYYADEIDIYDYWNVGDERKVSLSAMSATGVGESHVAQTVTMVLLNKGGKELVTPINGHTECAFVVGQKNCLANGTTLEGGYVLSSLNYNGYPSSERKEWCNETYRNAIPSTLRGIFKQHKNYVASNSTQTSVPTAITDYFILPSIKELTGSVGTANATAESKNSQFTYYSWASTQYMKKAGDSGSSANFWTSSKKYYNSTSSVNAYQMCYVDMAGSTSASQQTNLYGIAPQGVI